MDRIGILRFERFLTLRNSSCRSVVSGAQTLNMKALGANRVKLISTNVVTNHNHNPLLKRKQSLRSKHLQVCKFQICVCRNVECLALELCPSLLSDPCNEVRKLENETENERPGTGAGDVGRLFASSLETTEVQLDTVRSGDPIVSLHFAHFA